MYRGGCAPCQTGRRISCVFACVVPSERHLCRMRIFGPSVRSPVLRQFVDRLQRLGDGHAAPAARLRRVYPQSIRLDVVWLARVFRVPPAPLWSHALRRLLDVLLCRLTRPDCIVKAFVALVLDGIFPGGGVRVGSHGKPVLQACCRFPLGYDIVPPAHLLAMSAFFTVSLLSYCIRAFFEADGCLGHRAALVPRLGQGRPWMPVLLGAWVHRDLEFQAGSHKYLDLHPTARRTYSRS